MSFIMVTIKLKEPPLFYYTKKYNKYKIKNNNERRGYGERRSPFKDIPLQLN